MTCKMLALLMLMSYILIDKMCGILTVLVDLVGVSGTLCCNN